MRIEVLAIGTELLLGQIADTNAAWLGEQLAAAGVDSHFHQAVGDNHGRIVLALRTALARSDGVIVSGGLGPTQDDITRYAIAEVMNTAIVRYAEIEDKIRSFFVARARSMPESNGRQADVPDGASVIEQTRGTAPGLICPVGNKVVYALPGVPHELIDMFERGVLPDLHRRMAASGESAVIASRVLRTWGTSESALAEVLAERFDVLERQRQAGSDSPDTPGQLGGSVTLAFLASGIEGIKVRLTARASDAIAVAQLLDKEEAEVRSALRASLGDVVFGIDDTNMEQAVADLLVDRGLTLGLAESLTGGLVSSRLVSIPGASDWFRGCVVSYDAAVKFSVLGVSPGPVVTATAAAEMASGARRVLGSDLGLALTGVAGPDEQDGQPPGTVFVGLVGVEGETETHQLWLPGDRDRVRQFSCISALDLLRRHLKQQVDEAAG